MVPMLITLTVLLTGMDQTYSPGWDRSNQAVGETLTFCEIHTKPWCVQYKQMCLYERREYETCLRSWLR